MRQIILGLFLTVSTTLFSQDFSFRTKYLTESISIIDKTTSFANVRVTYEENILKIYDITLEKYVIDKEVKLKEYKPNRFTGVTDAFLIDVDKTKRRIEVMNIKDVQESYTFHLHKY